MKLFQVALIAYLLLLLARAINGDTTTAWTQGTVVCTTQSQCSGVDSAGLMNPGDDLFIGFVFFTPNGFCALDAATATCQDVTLLQMSISGLFTIQLTCPDSGSSLTFEVPIHEDYLVDPGSGASPDDAFPSPDPTNADTYQGNTGIPSGCGQEWVVNRVTFTWDFTAGNYISQYFFGIHWSSKSDTEDSPFLYSSSAALTSGICQDTWTLPPSFTHALADSSCGSQCRCSSMELTNQGLDLNATTGAVVHNLTFTICLFPECGNAKAAQFCYDPTQMSFFGAPLITNPKSASLCPPGWIGKQWVLSGTPSSGGCYSNQRIFATNFTYESVIEAQAYSAGDASVCVVSGSPCSRIEHYPVSFYDCSRTDPANFPNPLGSSSPCIINYARYSQDVCCNPVGDGTYRWTLANIGKCPSTALLPGFSTPTGGVLSCDCTVSGATRTCPACPPAAVGGSNCICDPTQGLCVASSICNLTTTTPPATVNGTSAPPVTCAACPTGGPSNTECSGNGACNCGTCICAPASATGGIQWSGPACDQSAATTAPPTGGCLQKTNCTVCLLDATCNWCPYPEGALCQNTGTCGVPAADTCDAVLTVPPSTPCPNDCNFASGNGDCVLNAATNISFCVCSRRWHGPDCSLPGGAGVGTKPKLLSKTGAILIAADVGSVVVAVIFLYTVKKIIDCCTTKAVSQRGQA